MPGSGGRSCFFRCRRSPVSSPGTTRAPGGGVRVEGCCSARVATESLHQRALAVDERGGGRRFEETGELLRRRSFARRLWRSDAGRRAWETKKRLKKKEAGLGFFLHFSVRGLRKKRPECFNRNNNARFQESKSHQGERGSFEKKENSAQLQHEWYSQVSKESQ